MAETSLNDVGYPENGFRFLAEFQMDWPTYPYFLGDVSGDGKADPSGSRNQRFKLLSKGKSVQPTPNLTKNFPKPKVIQSTKSMRLLETSTVTQWT